MDETVILTLGLGGLIGLALGATGSGGSLLALPLLVYVLHTTVQEATAMSLVVVGASALIGVYEYGRAGAVRVKAALVFSSTGAMGAWLGASGNQLVRGEVILLLFGMLMLATALRMWRGTGSSALNESSMECGDRFPAVCWIKVSGLGLLVGTLTGFFGVGGGFVIVPVLVLILGFPLRIAVGTSLLIIALVSVSGIVAHLRFGGIDGRLTALLIAGSAVVMMLGTRLARRMSADAIAKGFALFAGVTAIVLILHNAAKLVGGVS